MFDDFSVVGIIEVLDVLFVLVEEENVLGQPLNDGQHVHVGRSCGPGTPPTDAHPL